MTSSFLNLQARDTTSLLQYDTYEYERPDKLRIDGMKYAEKKYSKLKRGGVP